MLNRFNAKEILSERWRNRRGIPWTPIQCFGLPLNEFLPDACRLQSTAQGSAAEVSLLASAAIPQPTEIDHG